LPDSPLTDVPLFYYLFNQKKLDKNHR